MPIKANHNIATANQINAGDFDEAKPIKASIHCNGRQ